MAGIFAGMAVAVAMYLFSPMRWAESWQADWIPRFLALLTTVVFWCVAVSIRGYRIHCGGTQEAKSRSDKDRNFATCMLLLFGLVVAMAGYMNGNEWIFFVPCMLTLAIAASEVGWGDPFKMINGIWT
jgi:hypothetical protein